MRIQSKRTASHAIIFLFLEGRGFYEAVFIHYFILSLQGALDPKKHMRDVKMFLPC